jgi:hypothetical protein
MHADIAARLFERLCLLQSRDYILSRLFSVEGDIQTVKLNGPESKSSSKLLL